MPVTHHDAVLLGAYALLAAGIVTSGCALRPRFGREQYDEALEAARITPPPERPDPEPDPEAALDLQPDPRGRLRPGRVRRRLADPATWEALAAAVGHVATEAAPAWPYAVLLGKDTVTVRLAGPSGREPAEPWRKVPGGWSADVNRVAATGPSAGGSDTYVALGGHGRELVLLDLGCAPGLVTVTGNKRAAKKLVSALVAQIEAIPGRRVLVARGTLPDAPDSELSELLDGFDRAATAGARPVFLVCAEPTEDEALRLSRAVARHPRLRVLVLGALHGSRWSLTVDEGGWVTAAELGLAAASAVLPAAVPERRTSATEPKKSEPTPREAPAAVPARSKTGPDRPPRLPRRPAVEPPAAIAVGAVATAAATTAATRPVVSPEIVFAVSSAVSKVLPRDGSEPVAPPTVSPKIADRQPARPPAPSELPPAPDLDQTLEMHRALAPLPDRTNGAF